MSKQGEHGIGWTDETCSKCRRALPAAAFARDRTRPNGRTYVCRNCRNLLARGRYKRIPRKRHGWLTAARDGDRKQARRRINYLVEQGLIPRPDDLPCLDCADEVFGKPYRHEYDHAKGYGADRQLYVEPVCSHCHHAREEARHVEAA